MSGEPGLRHTVMPRAGDTGGRCAATTARAHRRAERFARHVRQMAKRIMHRGGNAARRYRFGKMLVDIAQNSFGRQVAYLRYHGYALVSNTQVRTNGSGAGLLRRLHGHCRVMRDDARAFIQIDPLYRLVGIVSSHEVRCEPR